MLICKSALILVGVSGARRAAGNNTAAPTAAQPIMIDYRKLGAAVRGKRGARSLREVEPEVGIGHATLHRIERETPCDLETFSRVCQWLGVPMDYFAAAERQAA